MNRSYLSPIVLIFILACSLVMDGNAQQFHALHGSSFAGAASMYNNPASPNNSLHRWDLNILAFQLANSSNSLYLQNAKLLSFENASLTIKPGTQQRNNHTNLNLQLLNAMYRINKKQTLAFGISMRMNNHIHTNAFNINDSMNRLNSFLSANRTTPEIETRLINAGWIEGNLNYSQVLYESKNSRLSGGISLQILKSLTGAFASINKLTYIESIRPSDSIYTLTGGVGAFAYSANADVWSPNFSTQGNINNFIKASKTNFGLSAGLEYISYSPDDVSDDPNFRMYNWKLGISILDLGSNQYNTSKFTGKFVNNNSIVTDSDLSAKLLPIKNAEDLRDSLNSLLDSTISLPKKFSINRPSRIVLNADHFLGNNFFINGQISIPLFLSNSYNSFSTNEVNFLTITPRWETRNWGIFIPIQYNLNTQLWAGFAFKAGPIVAGFHHIGLLKKDPLLNGGGYIILSVHPFSKKETKSRLDCF